MRTQAEDLPQDRQQPQDHQQNARGESNRSAHEIEEEAFDEVPNMALSEIRNKEGIYESIKEFLGRGR